MLLKLFLIGASVFSIAGSYAYSVYRSEAWAEFTALDSKTFTFSLVLCGAGFGLMLAVGAAALILALT